MISRTTTGWVFHCALRDLIAVLLIALFFIALRWLTSTTLAKELVLAVIERDRLDPALMVAFQADVFEMNGELSYDCDAEPAPRSLAPVGRIDFQWQRRVIGSPSSPVVEDTTLFIRSVTSSSSRFTTEDLRRFANEKGVPADTVGSASAILNGKPLPLTRPFATGRIRHADRVWSYFRDRWPGWTAFLNVAPLIIAAWVCYPRSLVAVHRAVNGKCPRCGYLLQTGAGCPECGLRRECWRS